MVVKVNLSIVLMVLEWCGESTDDNNGGVAADWFFGFISKSFESKTIINVEDLVTMGENTCLSINVFLVPTTVSILKSKKQ